MATLSTSYQKIGTGDTVTFGGAKGYLELWAKYNSQSIANNQTNYTIEARLVVTTGYIGDYTGTSLTLSGNGISSTQSCGTGNFTSKTLGSASGTTTHSSDGTNTVSCSAKITFKAWGKSLSASGSATCPTIPRYTSITQYDLSAINETQVKFTWAAANEVDSLYYSINSGSWVGASGNPVTISGLSANTSYNIKIKVKRKDSQLWTESSSKSVTTYDYPYCTETPNFTLGNAVTLKFYNPLGRSFTFYVIGNGTQIADKYYCSSTSYTGVNSSATSVPYLYATIPNAKSGKYQIKVVYGSSTKTRNNGNTYSINENNCKPTFTNFTYKDIDSRTKSLTNNDQILVDGKSDCVVTIPAANKAEAKNSASISKYICYWGNTSSEVAYSSTSDVSVSLYDKTGNTLKVTAVDSRGLTTTVTKTITNIAYVNAVINEVTTERKDGVDTETYLAFKATLWNGSWNNSSTESYNNTLKYVGYRVNNNGTWSDYYDITTSVLNNISIYKSGTSQTIELNKSNKLKIHSNGTSGGFESGKQFTIELLIKDGTTSYTYTPSGYTAIKQGTVTDGKIGMSRYKDSNGNYHYGFNGMPNDNYILNVVGKLGINGKNFIDIIYPIGSIYMSVNSTDPKNLFGGTWERLSGGFLYGAVSSAGNSTLTGTNTGTSSGSTGGPSTNTSGSTTLTTSQIPSHTHPHYVRAIYQYKSGDTGAVRGAQETGSTAASTGATGGGTGHTHTLNSHTHSLNSHTHAVPYMAVFVWKRTA